MIHFEDLAILRCPLDPGRTKLILDGAHLSCERCALRFKIEDGFPVLVVEEAELPAGCRSMDELPCRRESKK